MIVSGVDWMSCSPGIDSFAFTEIEVIGDYKAPVPRNVIYKIKNWKPISIALMVDK